MKIRGEIIKYQVRTGNGIIQYEQKSFIKFSSIDVINRHRDTIRINDKVLFYTANKLNENVAVGIKITSNIPKTKSSSKNKGIKEIVQYNYQNWEEVQYNYQNWEELEKIIEGEAEATKTIITPVYGSIDIINSVQALTKHDAKFIALGIFENKIKLVSLTKDGNYNFLDENSNNHHIIYPSHFEETILTIAIEEFEDLINSKSASENDFQNFF